MCKAQRVRVVYQAQCPIHVDDVVSCTKGLSVTDDMPADVVKLRLRKWCNAAIGLHTKAAHCAGPPPMLGPDDTLESLIAACPACPPSRPV